MTLVRHVNVLPLFYDVVHDHHHNDHDHDHRLTLRHVHSPALLLVVLTTMTMMKMMIQTPPYQPPPYQPNNRINTDISLVNMICYCTGFYFVVHCSLKM